MADSLPTCTFDDARYCSEQAKTMIERGRFMWLRARESLEDAQQMRVSLYAQIEELANRGPFRPQFTATSSRKSWMPSSKALMPTWATSKSTIPKQGVCISRCIVVFTNLS